MVLQRHRSLLGLTIIIALGALGFVVLMLSSNDLPSVPGMPRPLVMVFLGISSANLLLVLPTLRQTPHLPFLIRVLPIITASLFCMESIATAAETIVRVRGQEPVFTFPNWLFPGTFILWPMGELLRSVWEQPNTHAWLRITLAALISVCILVGFLFLWVSFRT